MWKECLLVALMVVAGRAQETGSQLLPSSDVSLVKFVYYPTPNNPKEIVYGDTASLQASNIVPNVPTIFLIDGFLSNDTNSLMTITLMKSLLALGQNWNIIIVNWGALSGGDTGLLDINTLAATLMYPVVLLNVPPVGGRVADFLHFLDANAGISQSQVQIIGHSLGAHIAGCAGASTINQYGKLVKRLTGLDPAGPLYYLSLSTSNMLYYTNGEWVDVYHTGRGGLGELNTNTGDIDVFVNGGSTQPGCPWPTLTDPLRVCDHTYSWKFFNHTITSNDLRGCPCTIGLLKSTCYCQSNCATCSNGILLGYNAVAGGSGKYFAADSSTYQ